MNLKSPLLVTVVIPLLVFQGCSAIPQENSKQGLKVHATPINISVSNMYMNHIEITPDFFHASCKATLKSFLSGYELKFGDDHANNRESTLATLPVEISVDDLLKFGFVEHKYNKGKLTAICRSVLHPETKKAITGIGFFLEGWNGKTWQSIESNRMYEQRAYNIINDILARAEKNMQQGAEK